MEKAEIKVVVLPHGEGLPPPQPATGLAAGADLRAAVLDDAVIKPFERALIPTGLVVEIPPGYEAQVRPRSGLAAKYGVTVLNAPGTIDADYRGEVKVILINLGSEPFVVKRGERIAQMVIAPVTPAVYVKAESLSGTDRGEDGFGSNGR